MKQSCKAKVFLGLGLAFWVAGCATTMSQLDKPMEKTRTFDASFDEVWKAAINTLTSSHQMITLTEKDSGVIGVDRTFSKEEIWDYVLIDGWNKFWKSWTHFASRTNFIIQPLGTTQTKVTVNAQIQGGEKKTDYNWVFGYATVSNAELALISSGKLEKEYLDMIEAQLPKLRDLKWIESGTKDEAPDALQLPSSVPSPLSTRSTEKGVMNSAQNPVRPVSVAPPTNEQAELIKAKADLAEEWRRLEEEKAKIAALKRQELETERAAQGEEIRKKQIQMEIFQIESVGLTKKIKDPWYDLPAPDVVTDRFSLSVDEKVVWYCQFRAGFPNLSAAFRAPQLTATWYDPSGKVFKQENFRRMSGGTEFAFTELKLDPSQPDRFVGTWRVAILSKGQVLDERRFEIIR